MTCEMQEKLKEGLNYKADSELESGLSIPGGRLGYWLPILALRPSNFYSTQPMWHFSRIPF